MIIKPNLLQEMEKNILTEMKSNGFKPLPSAFSHILHTYTIQRYRIKAFIKITKVSSMPLRRGFNSCYGYMQDTA